MGPPTKGTKEYDRYLLRQMLRKRATTKTKKRIAAEKLAKGLVLAERQRFKQEADELRELLKSRIEGLVKKNRAKHEKDLFVAIQRSNKHLRRLKGREAVVDLLKGRISDLRCQVANLQDEKKAMKQETVTLNAQLKSWQTWWSRVKKKSFFSKWRWHPSKA